MIRLLPFVPLLVFFSTLFAGCGSDKPGQLNGTGLIFAVKRVVFRSESGLWSCINSVANVQPRAERRSRCSRSPRPRNLEAVAARGRTS